MYFRYKQTPFCNEEKIDVNFFHGADFLISNLGRDIGDFCGNPAKFEFGAKISKSDFFSLMAQKSLKMAGKLTA